MVHSFVANLLFVTSIFCFANVFLKKQQDHFIFLYAVFLVWTLFYWNNLSGMRLWAFLHYFFAAFSLIFLFYKGTIKMKLSVFFGFLAFFLIVNKIAEITLYPFSQHDATNIIEGPLMGKAYLLIGIKSLSAFVKGRKKSLPMAYARIIFAVTVIEIYLLTISMRMDYRLETLSYHVLASFLLLDLILMYLLNNLQETYQLKASNLTLSYQLQAYQDHQTQYEGYMTDIRSFRHDIRNHLITMKELAIQEDSKQVIDYIEDLDFYNAQSDWGLVATTGNMTIDSLFNSKYLQMFRLDIQLKLTLEIPKELPFKAMDLTIVIGNLLDNAIEGAGQVQGRSRIIEARMRFLRGNLYINVANSYEGLLITKRDGLLETTKENPDSHGLGMKLIQKTVQKYAGLFHFEADGKMFKTEVLLYAGEI